MKNIFKLILGATLVLILPSCSGLFYPDASSKFISVDGTQFILDGKPYYFTGTNYWYGCYIGSPGETGDRERLLSELDFLKDNGITNLRILAASEDASTKNSLRPAIQKSPGVYDEELLEGLDFLLAEMEKREMYAVIFLNNYWEWSGGMAQYNNWFGGNEIPDLTTPNADWHGFMNFSASFYRNKEANEYFKQYIKSIVTRKNKFTGNYYLDDPAIMAWQLANEPRPGNGELADKYVDYYYAWIDSTAGYIHSIDPNHLVTTGSEGVMGSNGSEEYYLEAHSSEYIDFMTFHLWAKNWGWFRANNMEGTYPQTERNAVNYINKHIEYARHLGKPITLEEFGLGRDYEKTAIGSATTYRDRYFTTIFNLVYDSAKAGAPICGTNIWSWGGEGRAQNPEARYRNGDPFTGDPPQEPQGLNSVFNTDASTLSIIKNHSIKMYGLRKNENFSAKK
jgi:mannan endo-1,4-beta-mannosidase